MYNTLPVVPRLRPPLTVVDRAVYAVFAGSMSTHASTFSFNAAILFHREASGRVRIDYGSYGHDQPGFAISELWLPDEHKHVFISHRDRTILSSTAGRVYPSETDWCADANWVFEWGAERRQMLGVAAVSVKIEPAGRAEGVLAGTCWAAKDFGLVMEDQWETAEQVNLWRCSRLELTYEPDAQLFELPGAGYNEIP